MHFALSRAPLSAPATCGTLTVASPDSPDPPTPEALDIDMQSLYLPLGVLLLVLLTR